MIEGIDRTVDLVGVRSSGLTGAGEQDVVAAIRRCDTSALAATDGHFAAIAQDGRTVRLARTIGIPLRYFVAKMYHGPFLVVSDRIDQIFDWRIVGWFIVPAIEAVVAEISDLSNRGRIWLSRCGGGQREQRFQYIRRVDLSVLRGGINRGTTADETDKNRE